MNLDMGSSWIWTQKYKPTKFKHKNTKMLIEKKWKSKIKILTRRMKNTAQGISILKFVYRLFHKKQLYIPPKVVILIQHFS